MGKDKNSQFLEEVRQPIKDEKYILPDYEKDANGNNVFLYTYQIGKKKDQ